MKTFKQYLQEDQSLRQIQNTLMKKGYDLGPTGDDGMWGKYTAAAMSAAATSAPAASSATAAKPSATPATPATPTAAKPATTTAAPAPDANASTGEAGTTPGRQFVSYKTDPGFLPNPDKSEQQNQIEWEGKQKARSGFGTNTTYKGYDSSMTPQMNARHDYAQRMARQGFGGEADNAALAGVPDAGPEDMAKVNAMRDLTGTQPNPNQAELTKKAFYENAELTAMLKIAGLR